MGKKFFVLILLVLGIGIVFAQSFLTFDVYSGLASCVELDSGDDYFNRGNVTASFTSNPSAFYTYTDNCLNDLILSEGVCGQNVNQAYSGYGAIVSLDCDSNYGMICQYGACVQDTCNNNICGPNEDVNTCPQDCAGFCGDGVCNAYFGENYANCPQDCTFTNNWLIFESNSGLTVPFGSNVVSGLDAADQLCQTEATNLGFSGSFVAWLSNSTLNVRDRISDGVYVNLNQQIVANDKADLLDGSLVNAITPGYPTNGVTTGTDIYGIHSGQSCSDWTGTSINELANGGFAASTYGSWTYGFSNNCGLATGQRLFYCFQVA